MNEHIDAPSESSTPLSIPDSRCDDYPSYLDDTYGYAYAARDIVTLESLERHDGLVAASASALEEQDPSELDDFERLGFLHGWRRHSAIETCLEVAESLLDSEHDHPAVDYHEVRLLITRLLIEDESYERALSILEEGLETDDEPHHDRTYRRLQGLVFAQMGQHDRSRTHLDDLADDYPDDLELRYEIAEDFVHLGGDEEARRWIERTRTVAERLGDRAIEVDLTLLVDRLEA